MEEARGVIQLHTAVLETMEIPLTDAWGRVLAENVVADACYPSGDRSTMDGYVIGTEELPGAFRLVGEIPAGVVPDRALEKGEAMRIFTGALLPPGGGRVVMQEDVKADGIFMTVEAFSANRFIRRMGSEARLGDVVLGSGTRLGAAEMAILAQVGKVRPTVFRQPVVRHLATGNELVDASQIPLAGQIRDTNSTLLAALLKSTGISLEDSSRVVDDPQSLVDVADGEWDLLLVSGGASVGDYDFGAEALRRLGFTIHFDRVNLRPGKPLTFATRGRQAAFVIPGNPVSHFVCYHVAIRLAVECMGGSVGQWDFLSLPVEGGEPVRPDPRDTFWPAQVFPVHGELKAAPIRWSTSGDTFSLAGVNALVRVNATSPADGQVETLLLDLPAGDR